MFEIELKFAVTDLATFECRLAEIGALPQSVQVHSDTYYNHPCRDFVETREALRVRRCDGVPMITYKGAKLPGIVKARREMEWRLDPGDADGRKTEELLVALGFRHVATVSKRRQTFVIAGPPGEPSGMTKSTPPAAAGQHSIAITIDQVEAVGTYTEIEITLDHAQPSEETLAVARAEISAIAVSLGLTEPEPRSYLRMLLDTSGS